jgi:predicted DNA-binding transcriptional regulator YafY
MRLFRLFRLLDLMRLRTTPVTAQALSADLGVSVRSIYRDIADLQSMGAPIRGEGGIGYIMERGYFLPSLSFEADELDAIVLGLRLVSERSTPAFERAAQRAAAKIASSIGEANKQEMIDLPLEAGPSRAASAVRNTDLFLTLRKAIARSEVLRISYQNAAGMSSIRLARPLGLTVFDDTWLFTIWCETAEDFRHLRLDRIRSVESTEKRFRPEKGKRFKDALAIERAKQSLSLAAGQ